MEECGCIKIVKQGEILINGSFIHKRCDDIILVDIDCSTKYPNIKMIGYSSSGISSICLGSGVYTIKKSEEFSGDTIIEFSQFSGFRVWATHVGRYSIQISLVKEE